ncbi:MAG: hypothetical protein RR326_16645, partial [Stenotrophomonas sp.]
MGGGDNSIVAGHHINAEPIADLTQCVGAKIVFHGNAGAPIQIDLHAAMGVALASIVKNDVHRLTGDAALLGATAGVRAQRRQTVPTRSPADGCMAVSARDPRGHAIDLLHDNSFHKVSSAPVPAGARTANTVC